jgi:hypothetical protein
MLGHGFRPKQFGGVVQEQLRERAAAFWGAISDAIIGTITADVRPTV